jgi:predicted DNA-binding protein
MPRPKTYDTERVQIQVRLPAPLLARLDKEANRRVVSKTLLVERALEISLDEWEDEKSLASSY